ncbi:hypothetical protein Taro_050981 [Colocasia esculenta]|uniref:Uncharacterized protein n=1 Tax=Colocasia esculenta TaxID=4460 RepID=A0A843XET0_COLES|nr:hypothetical protein [Colocasia esculenta]
MRHVPSRLQVGKAMAPVSRFGCCCGCVPRVCIAGSEGLRPLAPPFFPFSSSLPFALFSGSGGLPLTIRHYGAAGSLCGGAARAWSEEEAANRRKGPFVWWFLRSKLSRYQSGGDVQPVAFWVATGWPSRSPLWFSSGFCFEGGPLAVAFGVATGRSSHSTFGGSDDALVAFLFSCCLAMGRWPRLGSGLLTLNATGDTPEVAIRLFWLLFCLVVFRLLMPCWVCQRWPTALPGFLEGVPCVPVPAGLVLFTRQLCRFCGDCPACSPGAWHLRACPVQRLSPLPGTPILGSLLREYSGLRACSRVETHASGGSRFGVLSVPRSRSCVPARDGTGVCSLPTWQRVWGPGWFCLWALDNVEVSGEESFLLALCCTLFSSGACGSTVCSCSRAGRRVGVASWVSTMTVIRVATFGCVAFSLHLDVTPRVLCVLALILGSRRAGVSPSERNMFPVAFWCEGNVPGVAFT